MEKNNKRLAIIGGGYMARIYAQNAHEMQIETYAFSLADGVVDKSAFDHIYDVNILDKDAVLEICKKEKINGVVATTELTISTAAYVAEMMGLIGIPYQISEVIADKYRNRVATKNVTDLHHPKYCEVNNYNEVLKLDYSYPLVLKPTSKGGKRGVIVMELSRNVQSKKTQNLK